MHIRSFDNIYVSELGEREELCNAFAENQLLEDLLQTKSVFKQSHFQGKDLELKQGFTATDVIRSATNIYNHRACVLARLTESHVDLTSDCCEEPVPCKTSRRKLHAAHARTFDQLAESFLRLISIPLEVIVERGTESMLCTAVEAVLAHLSFVDTVKLSLVRPLLTTYPANCHVHLEQSSDGVSATFQCLLRHKVYPVRLFSSTAVAHALEQVILAPCLTRILYCYWSCLCSNVQQFMEVVLESGALSKQHTVHYKTLLSTALREMELQEARLSLGKFVHPEQWVIHQSDSSDSRTLLSNSTASLQSSLGTDKSFGLKGSLPISLSTVCFSLQGEAASVNVKSIAREQAQRKQIRSPNRWSLAEYPWQLDFRLKR